jgi:hypothetical protein
MPRLVEMLATSSFVLCAGYCAAQQPNLSEPAPAPSPPAAAAQAEVRSRTEAPAASAQIQGRANADVQTPEPPPVGQNPVENAESRQRSIGAEINNEIQSDAGSSSGRAALGVTFSDGMTIGRISPNSPAAMLGLQAGDQIVRLNGEDFSDVQLFSDAIAQSTLDQDAEIVFLRNGQEHTVNGRLAAWDSVFTATGYAQPHTTMRFADPGHGQGGYVEGNAAVCCEAQPVYVDPCACDSGYFSGGYAGWHDDDFRYSRRAYRRGWGWGGWGW